MAKEAPNPTHATQFVTRLQDELENALTED